MSAKTFTKKDGHIFISGGDQGNVNVAGTLDASGEKPGDHGGEITVQGASVTVDQGSIQAKGINPDIVVEQSRIEKIASGKRTREADLHGALANPGTNGDDIAPEKKKDANTPKKKADAPQDYQLSRALDLLRGLSLYADTLTKRTN